MRFDKYAGKADLVYGGPPCQPFSTGGLRRAQDDKRNMIPSFLETLRTVRPDAFVMENVPGLTIESRISYLRGVLRELRLLGYVVTWDVLNAADYGVPQKRRRLFIVGLPDRPFRFPRPTHGLQNGLPYVRAGSVISREQPRGTPPDCPVRYAKYPDLRRSPYAGHLYNGGGRPVNLAEPSHTVLASSGGYKTHWVDVLDIAPAYHQHLMDGGAPREGDVPGARRLTVEESALLQTFPQDMVFCGSRSAQYTQIGDAVPPRLAEVIGKALIDQLGAQSVDEAIYWPVGHVQMELVL